MKKIAIIFSLCLTIYSCNGFLLYPHAFKEKNQIGRFKEGLDTHIDELININGYYYSNKKDNEKPFILYKDGTYGGLRFNFHSCLIGEKDIDWNYYISKDSIYYIPQGYYTIKNDTINVDVYTEEQLTRLLEKLRFKILDKETLLLFEWIYDSDYMENVWYPNKIFKFVPTDTLPSPNDVNGIKRKRWIWENKEDWKKYMLERKKKKKELKKIRKADR